MIKPEDIQEAAAKALDPRVEKVVDTLLAKAWDGRQAKIKQDDIVEALVTTGLSRADVFGDKMLDFEEAYRFVGWKVVYEKPAYNESGISTFTFTKK